MFFQNDQKLVSEDPKKNPPIICNSSLETSQVSKDLRKTSKTIKNTLISVSPSFHSNRIGLFEMANTMSYF